MSEIDQAFCGEKDRFSSRERIESELERAESGKRKAVRMMHEFRFRLSAVRFCLNPQWIASCFPVGIVRKSLLGLDFVIARYVRLSGTFLLGV